MECTVRHDIAIYTKPSPDTQQSTSLDECGKPAGIATFQNVDPLAFLLKFREAHCQMGMTLFCCVAGVCLKCQAWHFT
jgi:hypothetical protein